MRRLINNIRLWWLLFSKRNKCSIRHFYVPVKYTYESGIVEKRVSIEWWYEQALRKLGYGDGWSPEGMPKRMIYWSNGILTKYAESHQKFYESIITEIKNLNK